MLTALLFAASLQAPAAPAPQAQAAELHPIGKAQVKFTENLLRDVAKQPGNSIFSPFSIHTALSMVHEGARGDTARELEAALAISEGSQKSGFEGLLKRLTPPKKRIRNKETNDPAFKLFTANALWVQDGFPMEESFMSALRDGFGAAPERVDFKNAEAARERINGWVSRSTETKIQQILPPGLPSSDSRFVLANAIYLHAQWAYPFNPDDTRPATFFAGGEREVNARTMVSTRHLAYRETAGARIVSIPYESKALSMVIVLPKERKGLEAVLQGETPADWTTGFETKNTRLFLPAFKTTTFCDLRPALERIGVRTAWNASKADFTGMSKADPLVLSFVLHKATIVVDEKGTEAAAATAAGVKVGAAARPEQPLVFQVDHPFLYLIRHEPTGAILFAGRIDDPTATAE